MTIRIQGATMHEIIVKIVSSVKLTSANIRESLIDDWEGHENFIVNDYAPTADSALLRDAYKTLAEIGKI